MKTIYARLTFTEEVLGTASADPNIHSEFIKTIAANTPCFSYGDTAAVRDACTLTGK